MMGMLYDEVQEYLRNSTTSDPSFFSLASLFVCSVTASSVKLRTKFGTVRPNIYGIMLGKSTISHKTTIQNIVTDLLSESFTNNMITGTFSPEGLISTLAENPVAIMIKDEFGGLLEGMSKKDYMADSRDLLMELFDNKKIITRVLSKQKITVREPFFAMLTGVTLERFKETFNYNDIYSGFLVRFLVGLYNKPTEEREVDLLNHSLHKMKILAEIATIKQELDKNKNTLILSEEAEEYFNKYIKSSINENMDEFNLALRGRMNTIILKVAMIFYAMENYKSMSPEIPVEYIERGIEFSDPFFKNSQALFKEITMHPQVLRVADIIKEKGIAEHSYVLWRSHMKSNDLKPIIQTLVEMGLILETKNKGKTVYIYRNKEF